MKCESNCLCCEFVKEQRKLYFKLEQEYQKADEIYIYKKKQSEELQKLYNQLKRELGIDERERQEKERKRNRNTSYKLLLN